VEREASLRERSFIYTFIESPTGRMVMYGSNAWRIFHRVSFVIRSRRWPLTFRLRRTEEIARIKSIAANPGTFIRREQARQNDEKRAQQMLDLLSRAFTFEDDGHEGPWVRLNYKPDPDYTPQTYEERALHGMSGTLLIDGRSMHLHQLSGRLADDIPFGYGILGTIHRGSNFITTSDLIAADTWSWRRASLQTSITLSGVIIITNSIEQT
jgi:hypothetical protein